MKRDGLYTLDGIPANKENDYRRNWDEEYDDNTPLTNPENYRYDKPDKLDSLTNEKQLQMQKLKMSIDSLKQVKQREDQRLKDSLNNAKEKLEQKIQNIDDMQEPFSDNINPAPAAQKNGAWRLHQPVKHESFGTGIVKKVI